MKKRNRRPTGLRPMGERIHEAVVIGFIAVVILFLATKIVFF